MAKDEQQRLANVLGYLTTDVRHADLFGLQVPGQQLGNNSNMKIDCDLPRIESLRTSRRIEPDGQIRYSITKNVCSKLSSDNQKKFIRQEGTSYWTIDPKTKSILPKRDAFRLTHEKRP